MRLWPPGGRSLRRGSWGPPHPVRCGLANPTQPNLGRWPTASQPRDRRVIVLVKFIVASADVNGDELTVVLIPQCRLNSAVEDLAQSGDFLWAAAIFCGRHRSLPRCSILSFSLSLATGICKSPGLTEEHHVAVRCHNLVEYWHGNR